MSSWKGIDRSIDPVRLVGMKPEPLTIEALEEACELMMNDHGTPWVEYHNPKCPKILSKGKRACRCGASPLEGILEDDMMGRMVDAYVPWCFWVRRELTRLLLTCSRPVHQGSGVYKSCGYLDEDDRQSTVCTRIGHEYWWVQNG